ncbi:MAG TPA: pitrilysin family protein [Candidatus Izemoplasmatales bacterium]|nr:pitrilysin family protein [Bacillota bacterium]HRY78428.1 pitrilysin family protein [Candidatus Izemoplasmatales bacterium]
MEHRRFSGVGYTLQCIRTAKFKTFLIALRFAGAFSHETLNVRAILPELLLDGTRKSPSREALQQRMDGLYGLSVTPSTDKVGRASVIGFDLKAVDGRYLPDGFPTLIPALDLLQEIIYQPKQFRGNFRKKNIQEEVRLLREEFEAEYADKPEWAYQRFMKLMFAGELHQFRAKGDPETLGDLRAEDCLRAYQDLLANDQVTILAVGDFDPEVLASAIASRFRFGGKGGGAPLLDSETAPLREPRLIRESGDLSQARIHLGFRWPIRFGDSDFYAATLANAVLGEFDHSRLFRKIREEHSLCYFIQSQYDSNKGCLSVHAGTDPEQVDRVLALIAENLEGLRRGDLSDEELALAKESVAKRIRQNADSPESLAMLDFLYHRLLDREYSPEASLARLAAVQKEDVLAALGRLRPDLTYVAEGRVSP